MKLVVDERKDNAIELGDVVVLHGTVTTNERAFIAVKNMNVADGKLTLISLDGSATKGSQRGKAVTLESFLRGMDYTVYKANEWQLKLIKGDVQ